MAKNTALIVIAAIVGWAISDLFFHPQYVVLKICLAGLATLTAWHLLVGGKR